MNDNSNTIASYLLMQIDNFWRHYNTLIKWSKTGETSIAFLEDNNYNTLPYIFPTESLNKGLPMTQV
jgi:hypothetical protein